ncbi:MAG: glycine cleavage system aminomethyltransferase GcvT [Propionibacteriaceae bacterium]|jgi:aminomethyltransferase|nr:glycine cleavage system aminomethyltransferase GcvT [Propionibacteriaceae bacterium]
MSLVSSPLEGVHKALGAKFAQFGGWEMPLEYAGVLAEHQAVRERVGVFDVSHLGTFLVAGSGAKDWLNSRLTNDLDRISAGQAQYTLLLDEAGGVVDDMIVYVFSPDKVMVIPNASNSDEVIARLRAGAPADLSWTDFHQQAATIAVQGPRSADVLAEVGLPTDLAYMSFAEVGESDGLKQTGQEGQEGPSPLVPIPDDVALTVCRTGYTGEKGYEIVAPASRAVELWESLMRAGEKYGIAPCGLGARDTLRTEMGYPLHGNDLSRSISPVEARVGWAVGWKKEHFDGDGPARALKASGPSRVLLGIRACGRGIPRHGMSVVDDQGATVGEVTSGTFSPTLKVGVGLAFLPAETKVGDEVLVQIRNRTEAFEVVKPPFVASHVTD